ncbi:sialate O-acetylesterase [Mycolicibacterium sp.]|uniref:sialate O-acetylesterase n=1 Tax=Mycolicibacterium sp. TaxID=2320850 RepID=UPI001A23360D|nr:sialate O-acetylesterase [Mycolicibacterium sp.]MBJ7339080.1 sialate O-acetylesterase [Mycolicibacterium sp.]
MNAARAPRNPDGDSPLLTQLVVEAKCFVKRRLAPRGDRVGPPESPYLVVPVLGQSNAQGMGFGLDLDGLDRPHPLVHQWAMCGRSKNKAIVGVDPLIHEVPSKGVGFGMTFAKLLAEATGRAVLLIPGARGDTSFTPKNGYSWDPQCTKVRVNLYRKATRAIDEVLRTFPGSEVATILWHQGETDVPLTPGPVYQAKLDLVIDSLRERYGSDVPFILGGMVPEEMENGHRDYPVINAVHEDTPNRRPRTAFVPGPRDSFNSAVDPHYNGAAQRELGRRMFGRYQALCGDDPANSRT